MMALAGTWTLSSDSFIYELVIFVHNKYRFKSQVIWIDRLEAAQQNNSDPLIIHFSHPERETNAFNQIFVGLNVSCI